MKRLLSASAVLLGFAPFVLPQDLLRVGDVSAVPGTKATGVIRVPEAWTKVWTFRSA